MLNNMNLGKAHVFALSSSIKGRKFKELVLSSINNNEEGIIDIFKNLPIGLQKLDASKSSIGERSLLNLFNWLRDGFKQNCLALRYLNLSNNKISNFSAFIFCKNLKTIEVDLIHLDLSKNFISDSAAGELAEVVEASHTLKILNLGWNHIGAKGAIPLFVGIKSSAVVRNFTLAYNRIGRGESEFMIEQMSQTINEGTLKHLDLSYNNLSYHLCQILADKIEKNHTLFGIHMQGNEWYVDANGFIKVNELTKDTDYSKHTVFRTESRNGYSTMLSFRPQKPSNFIKSTTCWVCEGWTESTFSLTLGKSVTEIEEPVYIHFDFNNYLAELMISEDEKVFSYTTMWPPGLIKYFFTVNKIPVTARDHDKYIVRRPSKIENIVVFDEVKTFRISKFNTRMMSQGQVLDEFYNSLLKTWYPRREPGVYVPPRKDPERPPWKRENSVFAAFIADSQKLMDEIFENDWALIQKPKFKNPEDEDEIKKILKENYWYIREIYKTQAAMGTSTTSPTFCIPLNQYYEFTKSCNVTKDKGITVSEVDTIFLVLNKRYENTTLNPGTALVRFQFLEVLMRIGISKANK